MANESGSPLAARTGLTPGRFFGQEPFGIAGIGPCHVAQPVGHADEPPPGIRPGPLP